jgi:putative hydrolase of the HAD superfamily
MFCSPSFYVWFTELLLRIGQHLYKDFSGGKNWMVFPDVIPSLEEMKAAGITIGAISNFDDRLRMYIPLKVPPATCTMISDGILESLKLAKYFNFVLAAYEVSCAKPDVK